MTYADALHRIETAEPFPLAPGVTVSDPPKHADSIRRRLADAGTAPQARRDLRRALAGLGLTEPDDDDD